MKTYPYCLSLFIVILNTMLNKLELLKKAKKKKKNYNYSFLTLHTRFYEIVKNSTTFFLIIILTASLSEK